VATPACYCSADCQKKDWPRHKEYHRHLEHQAKQHKQAGFSVLKEGSFEAMANDENDCGDFEQLMMDSARCMAQGDNLKARRKLEKAVKLEPENPVGHHNLALLYGSSLNVQESVEQYAEAMMLIESRIITGARLTRDEEELWGRCAASIFASYQVSPAELSNVPKPSFMLDNKKLLGVAEQAAKFVPSYNEAWGMLGHALELKNEFRRSEKCYRKAERVSEGAGNKARFRVAAKRVNRKRMSREC